MTTATVAFVLLVYSHSTYRQTQVVAMQEFGSEAACKRAGDWYLAQLNTDAFVRDRLSTVCVPKT